MFIQKNKNDQESHHSEIISYFRLSFYFGIHIYVRLYIYIIEIYIYIYQIAAFIEL